MARRSLRPHPSRLPDTSYARDLRSRDNLASPHDLKIDGARLTVPGQTGCGEGRSNGRTPASQKLCESIDGGHVGRRRIGTLLQFLDRGAMQLLRYARHTPVLVPPTELHVQAARLRVHIRGSVRGSVVRTLCARARSPQAARDAPVCAQTIRSLPPTSSSAPSARRPPSDRSESQATGAAPRESVAAPFARASQVARPSGQDTD